MISASSQLAGMIFCLVVYYVIMYDPQVSFIFSRFDLCRYFYIAVIAELFIIRKGAWSSRTNVPDWVSKRIQPLTKEQVQEIPWMDKLIQN